jgi:uroporphyrin-3 C-methyltransferase/uroporphyrinogen III methyltransferase/synthase
MNDFTSPPPAQAAAETAAEVAAAEVAAPASATAASASAASAPASAPTSAPAPGSTGASTSPAAAPAPVLDSHHNQPAIDMRLIAVCAVLALLLLVQWFNSHQEIRALRDEVAQRLQKSDISNAETRVVAKAVQDGSKEWQAKVSVLENKQAEAQSQQVALEQLYQDLSKNRDEWALAEIEQVISTASQQLQLAGNVSGALIALQNADRTLSRSDRPQFIAIRAAISRDVEKLKGLPLLDLTGIALRIDSVIGQIDSLPLLSDEKPPTPVSQPKKPLRLLSGSVASGAAHATKPGEKAASNEPGKLAVLWQWTEDALQSWSHETWQDVRQLVQVRSVDKPEALLMSPREAYYVRENLKLRLLNARLALLSRNESAFRSDLIAAQDALTRFFDTRAKQTQTAQAFLKAVQGSNLSIEMPNLAESLNAVRNYKARP